MTNWQRCEVAAPPAELHQRDVATCERTLTWCRPTVAQLILGSTQDDSIVDMDALSAAGLTVARRRSGGGAVLVRPEACVWIDCFVPVDDPLWRADVGESFGWFGQAWAHALAELGLRNLVVHEGALRRGRWGREVCFAGVGPGEVVCAGRKLVGISSRRTRQGAWFQSMLLLDSELPLLATLLRADCDELSAVVGDLASLPPTPTQPEVVAALLAAHFPRA